MREKLNKNYPLKVEVLTPLHIGGGEENNWQKDLDFFCSNGTLRLINRQKLFASLSEQDINRLSAYMAAGKLNEFRSHVARDKALLENITIRNFALKQEPGQDKVVALIRNGNGQNYLPGSSLKGAIRSILFKHLKPRNKDNEENVFGNISEDWMRLIRITDAPFQRSEIIHTKTFNLQGNRSPYEGGWKHAFKNGTDGRFNTKGFITTFEVLPPDSTGMLRMSLSDGIYEFIQRKGNHQIDSHTADFVKRGQIEQLFGIINRHTAAYLEKEIKFYQKFPADQTELILDQLKELLKKVSEDNQSCMLRIGLGSGFHSITGDWQHDDFTNTGVWNDGPKTRRGNFKVKSRKLAFSYDDGSLNLLPMGFIKLTLLSDEEYQQQLAKETEKEQEAIRQEQTRQIEAAQAAEAERLRQEQEAEAARKAAEEARQPQYFTGKLKPGVVVDAFYNGPVNPLNPKQKKFKLLIDQPGKEQEVLLSYASDLDKEAVYLLKVINVSKKGQVQSVMFISVK